MLEPIRTRSSRTIWPGLKRLLDILLAGGALVLLSPLLVSIAVLVRLDSPGPALFRQQRVGRGFRQFTIYKFRSMIADATGRGSRITIGADPRITRVGRVLRRTKLDELPQLWNILRGEMSFVGPRPEVPHFVEMFHDDYAELLTARPGLTDPATLAFRNEEAMLAKSSDPQLAYVQNILPHKIALSREYVQHSSLLYDLRLIGQTMGSMLLRR